MIETRQFGDITQIRMSRVIDGIPLFWVAAYLVDGLLIDTGCSYTAAELVSWLEKSPPRLAVNTHYHEDHIGANRLLQERFGIPIYAHSNSIPFIRREANLFPYQEVVWGYPDPTEVLPIPPAMNTERFSFDVIETPGHSAGHVVLVESSRGWCFCGDMFAGETVKVIRPEEDMGALVASLKNLAQTETENLTLFTAAGGIVENGREALKNVCSYLEDLSQKAKGLQNEGRTVREIMTSIFGGEHPRAGMTDGQFSTENLIRSALKM